MAECPVLMKSYDTNALTITQYLAMKSSSRLFSRTSGEPLRSGLRPSRILDAVRW